MAKDQKGMSLVILGVVSVIAVIGLVMMFTGSNSAIGQATSRSQVQHGFTSGTGGYYLCDLHTSVGEPQWFPILAEAGNNQNLARDFFLAGYTLAVVRNGEIVDSIDSLAELNPEFFDKGGHYVDEFGYQTVCAKNPTGVPVNPRSEGKVTLDTRRDTGVPARVGEQRTGI